MADKTKYLDRGDGTCRHYQQTTRQCSIYDNRPNICRVDVQFQQHYAALMSWKAFVDLNAEACRFLQKQADSNN